jgi:RNA polymerase sigma-70 factor (ECF subfamily)
VARDEAIRRERFRALYDENYPLILGYARRRVGEVDAADVVSETFLVAWRRLEDAPSGDNMRLWLYGVARRVLANTERARRRRARLAQRAQTALGQSADPGQIAHHRLAAATFARLRPDEQELLALVAWEGLGAAEIAAVLGCSANAVRIRLHRARRRFIRELERHGAGGEAASRGDRPNISLTRTEELL